MKATVSQKGDVTVINVSGKINYETVDPFRETCMTHLREKKLVFNLQGLNFVGSSGISQFVRTLEDLATNNPQGLKICSASSEFYKILVSSEIPGLEIFEEEFQAQQSFMGPQVHLPQT